MLPGRVDALQHDPLAIAFAAHGGDDTSDGNLLHMRPGRAYPAQGDDLVAFREPQMDGSLVIPVHVLIDTVLLHDENLAADAEEFVELVHRQVGKRFLMKYGRHGSKIRIISYLCPRHVLEKTHICRLAAVGRPADGVPCAFPSSRHGAAGRCFLRRLLAASSASRASLRRYGNGGVSGLPTAIPAVCARGKHGHPVVFDRIGSACPSDSRGHGFPFLPTFIPPRTACLILPLVYWVPYFQSID